MPVRALLVLKFRFRLHAELIVELSTCLKSKLWRRWELLLNPTNQVKEFYGGRNSQKELQEFHAERFLNIGLSFQISPANEVCLCSPVLATREILSSRRRTSSKPLLSERGDHEELQENESLRPKERKILGMEDKGREERTL
jgi:hypothetical protein